MKCKITCSVGDLIDKITILKIKLNKIKRKDALENIKIELDTITNENPLSNKEDKLFTDLYQVNLKLWFLEDCIRMKSKKKEFDEQYISYAENIHIKNDERYKIKKSINEKYNSELIEEKSYIENIEPKNNSKLPFNNKDNKNDLFITEEDKILLENGKCNYNEGNYNESLNILVFLINKFKNYQSYNNFYVDLLFAYENILNIFNFKNIYFEKNIYVIKNLEKLDVSNDLRFYCKQMYASYNLSYKNYLNSYPYLNYINYITGPNVNPENICFFKEHDINKTLLIYDGGGIGDKFMFSRFVKPLCDMYNKNNIILVLPNKLIWLFHLLFKNQNNLTIISDSNLHNNLKFDYHCSLITLIKYLKLDYNTIAFTPLFSNINLDLSKFCIEKLNRINLEKNKKKYIFNWKGNDLNPHEKFNRKMELKYARKLFELNKYVFIVITKNLTDEERIMLDKYNIHYFGDEIDNGSNSFEDSIGIMKNVDGVISTDTSLVHLSNNLGVKTYTLLTTGCEWRWTKDKYTKWYPDNVLIRQKDRGDWDSVINKLIDYLQDDELLSII